MIRDLHFLTFDLIGINDKRDSWIIFVIISVIFVLVNQWAAQLLQYVKIRCVSVKEYLRSFVTRETDRWFNGDEFLIERHPRITVEPPLKANSPERPPLYKGPFFSSRRTKKSIHWLLFQPHHNPQKIYSSIEFGSKQFSSRFMWRDRVWLTAHRWKTSLIG